MTIYSKSLPIDQCFLYDDRFETKMFTRLSLTPTTLEQQEINSEVSDLTAYLAANQPESFVSFLKEQYIHLRERFITVYKSITLMVAGQQQTTIEKRLKHKVKDITFEISGKDLCDIFKEIRDDKHILEAGETLSLSSLNVKFYFIHYLKQNDKTEINIYHLQSGNRDLLGKGHFGHVYKIYHLLTGNLFAIKFPHSESTQESNYRIKSEYQILKKIHSQFECSLNIQPPPVALLYIPRANEYALVLPLCSGDLKTNIQNGVFSKIPFSTRFSMCLDLLSTAEKLVKANWRFFDICSSNTLIDVDHASGNMTPQLSDLDGAYNAEETLEVFTSAITTGEASPIKEFRYAFHRRNISIIDFFNIKQITRTLLDLFGRIAKPNVRLAEFKKVSTEILFENSERAMAFEIGVLCHQILTLGCKPYRTYKNYIPNLSTISNVILEKNRSIGSIDSILDPVLKNKEEAFNTLLNCLNLIIKKMVTPNPFKRITVAEAYGHFQNVYNLNIRYNQLLADQSLDHWKSFNQELDLYYQQSLSAQIEKTESLTIASLIGKTIPLQLYEQFKDQGQMIKLGDLLAVKEDSGYKVVIGVERPKPEYLVVSDGESEYYARFERCFAIKTFDLFYHMQQVKANP